jgi:hypothetical protein
LKSPLLPADSGSAPPPLLRTSTMRPVPGLNAVVRTRGLPLLPREPPASCAPVPVSGSVAPLGRAPLPLS